MGNMVERVARAIKKYEAYILLETGSVNPSSLRYRQDVARITIEAMRDPTVDMLHDGAEDCMGDKATAKEVWQTMIDSALVEGGE